MAVYLIALSHDRPAVTNLIRAKHPTARLLAANTFAIQAEGSAQRIVLDLDLPDDERNGITVVQVAADYYGYNGKPFWDWLAAGFRENAGG